MRSLSPEPARGRGLGRGGGLCLTLALLATACLASSALASPANASADKTYDPIVDAVVARYHLPGIAVGVIENGQVVYTATRGETIAGSGQPITPQTLFKIASNSKAMTTALLGRLVDQGKLAWGDPVTKYLPDFRMADPWVTKNMRVADLLTHSSGLPEGGGDLMLWPEPNDFTRQDIIHGLRYIQSGYSFRSQYQYDNLLYVVAGEVAAAAGGASYEALMHREVFEPLGLGRCQVGRWNRDAVGDVAQPHFQRDGRNLPMRQDGPAIPGITSAPAGGIRCDLTDMLAWAKNWLAPTPAQLGWLSSAQRKELQAPHMLIPVSDQRRAWDHTHVMAYGYGWRMADVDGTWVVWHTGTLGGMYSMLALLPDRKSGFVFMINGEAGDARTVLGEVLIKHFTAPDDGHGVSWYADALDHEAAQRPAAARPPDTAGATTVAPSAFDWSGRYRDPWFGEIALCPREGAVQWASRKSPHMKGTVKRLGKRYLVQWDDPAVDLDAWLDPHAGAPPTLTMAKLDPLGDFSSDYEDLHFERIGDCL
ncbi:serine hydrolase domain-containing protein [Frateuria hangzhouensis]|uniref:serine hydrolase domain-containing protein n=1 Tax=Frateuria hangzhouensis TaxID=2995589 RepID=UPI00226092D8|nr:serine hydrolase domain-containing protein [Frateuria sp. STR12]MCX7512822.1 serine hydrolase [Frateuria sp. STR12]